MMRVIVKPAPARERMIQSAAALFSSRGVDATAFSDVIADSGAPRGSIYHHFPQGKAQLAEEATRYAGEYIAQRLKRALESGDPRAAVRGFAASWRRGLERSDFGVGCPVVAAALEGDRTPAAAAVAGGAFADWSGLIADALAAQGIDERRAWSLAVTVVASIEGAIVVARAQRSVEPLALVADEIERLVADALAEAEAG
jgi:AcrR family transcriptional regulator